MSTYQGIVVEKRICPATGKTIFDTKADAEEARSRFLSFNKVRISGKRIKHRMGKPQMKRSYLCEQCNGWHLTSMHSPEVRHNRQRKTLEPKNGMRKFRY